MITAKLEYRDYTSYTTFANLDFYGNSEAVRLLNNLTSLVKFQNYDTKKLIIDFLETKLEENRIKENQIIDEISNLKKKYKLTILFKYVRKKIKQLDEIKSKLYRQDNIIREEIENQEDSRFLRTSTTINYFRKMLGFLGFACETSSFQSHNDTTIEHYKCTKTDEEIIDEVKLKIKEYENHKNNKLKKVKKEIDKFKNDENENNIPSFENDYDLTF